MGESDVLRFRFADARAFPNNQQLPVLIFKRAGQIAKVSGSEQLAEWYEALWPKHGWRAAWRYGVYDFPHYHSTAHEILGVYRGHATLRLGDKTGVTVVAEVGDVIVLPAGTAHQNLGSSADFAVVGGYPDGQSADLLRGEAGERPGADRRIAAVALPTEDPMKGESGPLMNEWQR